MEDDTTTQQGVENGQEEQSAVEELQPVSQRDQVIAAISAKRNAALEGAVEDGGQGEELAQGDVDQQGEGTEAQPVPRTVRIKVDGVERDVDESDLIEAGKREMQKESAAAERLRQAAARLQELEQRQQIIEARERKLAEFLAKQKTAPDASLKEKAKKFAESLMDNEEEAVNIFEGVLGEQQRLKQEVQQVLQTVKTTQQKVQQDDLKRKTKLAQLFVSKFPAIAGDAQLAWRANERTRVLLRERPDLTEEEIVVQAGQDVKRWLTSVAGVEQTTADQHQDSPATIKKGMPRPIQKAAGRLPPKQEVKPQTRAEIIREKQRLRNPYAGSRT